MHHAFKSQGALHLAVNKGTLHSCHRDMGFLSWNIGSHHRLFHAHMYGLQEEPPVEQGSVTFSAAAIATAASAKTHSR